MAKSKDKYMRAAEKVNKMILAAETKGLEAVLKKNRISYTDFQGIISLLESMNKNPGIEVVTFMGNVADWFYKAGFNVQLDEHGVNFKIS